MNPEKRFGQIEELLADVIIKVDRLADGQGKLLDYVSQQREELANQGTQLARQGSELANQGTQLARQGSELANQGTQLARQGASINELSEIAKHLDAKIDSTARATADLTVSNQQEHMQMNNKLDLIIDLLREKLS